MYVVLLVLAVILFSTLKYRETFVVKYGNPFNDEDIISFDPNAKGTRVFGFTPHTCQANKPELQDGLCYEQCESGYNGVGPVCWANTKNVGGGEVPALKFRNTKINLWGMVGCSGGRGFRIQGYGDCFTIEVPVPYQECPNLFQDQTKSENIAGLCYKKCPKEIPSRVQGMPYLCYKGTRGLSYGRGVGDVPPLFTFS